MGQACLRVIVTLDPTKNGAAWTVSCLQTLQLENVWTVIKMGKLIPITAMATDFKYGRNNFVQTSFVVLHLVRNKIEIAI